MKERIPSEYGKEGDENLEEIRKIEEKLESKDKIYYPICKNKWGKDNSGEYLEKLKSLQRALEIKDIMYPEDESLFNVELHDNLTKKLRELMKKLQGEKNMTEKEAREILSQYLLYHLAIGSTPTEEQIKYFDLKGEDSILKLMEDVINPQTQEKQTQTEQKQNESSTNS